MNHAPMTRWVHRLKRDTPKKNLLESEAGGGGSRHSATLGAPRSKRYALCPSWLWIWAETATNQPGLQSGLPYGCETPL